MADEELCPIQKLHKVMDSLWDFGLHPYKWEESYRIDPVKNELITTDTSKYRMLRKKANRLRNLNLVFIWSPVVIVALFIVGELVTLKIKNSTDLAAIYTVIGACMAIPLPLSLYLPTRRKGLKRQTISEIVPLINEGYIEINRYIMVNHMVRPIGIIVYLLWIVPLAIPLIHT